MEVNSDHVVIIEKMGVEVCSGEEMSDPDLESKTESHEKMRTINFEKQNNSKLFQIIGEKRKNKESSYLKNDVKKSKDEFGAFEESDYKQDPLEIEEIHTTYSNNQVNPIKFTAPYIFWSYYVIKLHQINRLCFESRIESGDIISVLA
jgi:hypothetical protein